MEILVVSATSFEVEPLIHFLKKSGKELDENTFSFNQHSIYFLITGVGLVNTTYQLTKLISKYRPELVLNAGIAGSFDRSIQLGSVFKITKQYFGDLGVEEADKSFTDLFELELVENTEPFKNKAIENTAVEAFDFLPNATCISVNKVHGNEESIELIRQKYQADLEVMEGAAVAYVCTLEKLNYLELRSVSNFVENRNKDNWDIPLAIEQLNKTMIELLTSI